MLHCAPSQCSVSVRCGPLPCNGRNPTDQISDDERIATPLSALPRPPLPMFGLGTTCQVPEAAAICVRTPVATSKINSVLVVFFISVAPPREIQKLFTMAIHATLAL